MIGHTSRENIRSRLRVRRRKIGVSAGRTNPFRIGVRCFVLKTTCTRTHASDCDRKGKHKSKLHFGTVEVGLFREQMV